MEDQQREQSTVRLTDDGQEEVSGSRDDKEGILTAPSIVRSSLKNDDLSGRDEPGGGTTSDVGTMCVNKLEQTDDKYEVGTNRITNFDDNSKDGGLKTDEKCQFKRGVCTIHKIKANKMVRTKKTWVKKKNGLCGWNTTKLVYYTCS